MRRRSKWYLRNVQLGSGVLSQWLRRSHDGRAQLRNLWSCLRDRSDVFKPDLLPNKPDQLLGELHRSPKRQEQLRRVWNNVQDIVRTRTLRNALCRRRGKIRYVCVAVRRDSSMLGRFDLGRART